MSGILQQKGQQGTGSATSPTPNATLDAGATAGNLLIAAVAIDKAGGITTINKPSGWDVIHEQIGTATSVNGAIVSKIAAGGETSATWSWDGSISHDSYICEVSGITSATLDRKATPSSGDTLVTSFALGPLAALTATGYCIALMIADSGNTWSAGRTWSNGFVEKIALGTDNLPTGVPGLFVAELDGLALNSTPSTTIVTTSAGDQVFGVLASFKAGAADVPPGAPTSPQAVVTAQ